MRVELLQNGWRTGVFGWIQKVYGPGRAARYLVKVTTGQLVSRSATDLRAA